MFIDLNIYIDHYMFIDLNIYIDHVSLDESKIMERIFEIIGPWLKEDIYIYRNEFDVCVCACVWVHACVHVHMRVCVVFSRDVWATSDPCSDGC